MPKPPPLEDNDAERDDIPELDEIVAPPSAGTPPGDAPPPNFDMFADTGLDVAALREALAGRVTDEIDAALAELRAEFEEALRRRVETRLRDRLPDIIESVLAGPGAGDKPQ